MKKNRVMRKNTFVKGAFIATLGIVLTKILGILYVIPFYAIVGNQGGALYGYAYSIYLFFMALSSAGIPLAISKLTAEFQTLGYYKAKEKTFNIGKKIAFLLGTICFLILFILAPVIAKLVLGNLSGGNSINDVVLVIRVVATAILVVPILSIYRGYFEGHKFMGAPSVSQVLEQIVRVLFIIIGSFLTLRVLKLSLATTVGVAVFGATIGAFSAYLYLVTKYLNNKRKFKEKILEVKEPRITSKDILQKLIIYALPFIMIDVSKSLYNFIDVMTINRTLGETLGYNAKNAELITGIISTWASKFNMIIISISTGVIVSLIPNLTTSFVKKDMQDVRKKINQSLQILLYLTIPMTVGLSFLAKPVWMLFYGPSKYGSSILSYIVIVAIVTSLATTAITIAQVLKYYKVVAISLITGLILKLTLNTTLMVTFNNMGLPPYYGSITATIIGYISVLIICLTALYIKCGVNYESTVREGINIFCGTVLMMITLYLLRYVVPIYVTTRILNLFIIIFYTIIGAVVYFIYTYKSNTIEEIFGSRIINKLLKILHLKK